MRKNISVILFLFILANITFADDISNIEKYTNENGLNSHRNSLGVNFGSTIFYTLIAPSIANIVVPSNNREHLKLQGTFALDLTYTFRIFEKMDFNLDAGFYSMKTYYNNSSYEYNGNVYGIGFSLGSRFYINNKDRASGFFLMPKLGGTLFITQGKEYQKSTMSYTNLNSNIFDFYISGEIGFRIDISRGLGINSGVRPFFDISIIDIGFSYKSIIRVVPLPRFAIGILV